ncbi:aminopeptidase N [Tessaracoccus sp. ZS01]|uniref:aminopeptidase N n=1 Tax=Tessaracoccus sp. ZS01 TaxID=1906324 RepID=UPI00096DC001|nr:aminopeptidase N [Tessaracoccus sp. ZS01]MCG6567160.1 aminopeptidase N [Tessaracoccus sp. ZS01]OMG57562.1 aminopeptidase N [Tessaracoccus sp. ZS01]
MATANITRDEAVARSQIMTTEAYRVLVDLTGREVEQPARQFVSTTHLTFSSAGGSTYLDLIADDVREATLDGEAFDTSSFDGYRLPLPELEEGRHEVQVVATCRYSNTGEGLHRFVDPADDAVYLYTQFETADARRMFANAEQPDQKATFQLTVLAPSEWVVFTNSARVEPHDIGDGFGRFEHEPTPPVATYITALVCGEFHVVEGAITTDGKEIPASVACRRSLAQYLDADRILTTTQRGFEVFEDSFGVPYPFSTYDQIFVPEFNAGAMENAGCVTFRDEYLFRSRVTSRELDARDNTILHELAHMWFGDLVTMRWWNDLWLNESFAEWASHYANDEISKRYDTGTNSWASFSNERKAWAYLQDQLSTTHPIAADMSDLEKVEQNFDGITYAKGASVLKLLVSIVGREAFLAGVHEYFQKHAWGNTELSDLLVELEAASGRDLSWFSAQWLETAGVNTLAPSFDLDDEGRFTRFDVVQTAHPDWPTLRTHRLGIGIYALGEDGLLTRSHYVETDVDGERTAIEYLVGVHRGDVVLLNDGDLTYAKVRFDDDSSAALVEHIGALTDPLARAVSLTAFWEMTRDAEFPAQQYKRLVQAALPSENDMAGASTLLAQASNAALAFTAPELRDDLNTRWVAGLAQLLKETEPGSDKQVLVAKALIGNVRSAEGIELIRGWLNGEEVPEGLAIDTGMRWAITAALAKLGAIGHDEISAELDRDNTSAGAEQAAGAGAALPDVDSKSQAWALATDDPDVPNETHRSICMGFWRYGQDEVLEPYPAAYLDLLGRISRREGTWADRGYATVGTALRWLFPTPLVTESLVATIQAWLDDNEPSEQVRRSVTERLDEARRSLRAQERSRLDAS